MRTSLEWWNEVRDCPSKLEAWLLRQYVGEIAAVHLLSEVLLKYGGQATDQEWLNVHRVMVQEATHARWVKKLLDDRGIALPQESEATRRYWSEVLPNVTNFREACAAGFHAESMHLERIRVIANDPAAPVDIRETFARILPHEEWHESVFDAMRSGTELTRYHEKGLQALNLVLA